MRHWLKVSGVKQERSVSNVVFPSQQLRIIVKRIVCIAPFFLAGCLYQGEKANVPGLAQPVLPNVKITDYRTAPCQQIWEDESAEEIQNPLYWLRVMDCAERFDVSEARARAKGYLDVNWQNTFKKDILLSNSKPTAAERRQILQSLDKYSKDFPYSLRSIWHLWRETHRLELALLEEKRRYVQLQERTDTKIDTLLEQQGHLQYKLSETTRKLASLTDIEKQLSSRKQLQSVSPSTPSEDTDTEDMTPSGDGQKETVPNVSENTDTTSAGKPTESETAVKPESN